MLEDESLIDEEALTSAPSIPSASAASSTPASAGGPSEPETEPFDFEGEFQKKVLALFMRDPQFAMKARDLIKPVFFSEQGDQVVAQIVLDYVQKFKSAPGSKLMVNLLKDAIAGKKFRPDLLDEVKDSLRTVISADISGSDYVLEKVASFAKQRAIFKALEIGLPALEKENYDFFEKHMTAALSTGTILDRGEYDFWEEAANRKQEREDFNAGKLVRDGITSGLPALDNYLYHLGWGRKELSLIMAPAKGGKSALLIQFGLAASTAGFNVIHFTLENSAKITAERVEASLTETIMRELHKDPASVEAKTNAFRKSAGHYKIREYATGTLKTSELRRVLEEYRSKGIIFDLIVVDYADIMMPERWTDNNIDNSKSIYVDLRAVGFDYNAAVLTATQTNREGAKAVTSKATDVAEDFNRIRIADAVIAINATESERADKKARLTFVAMRNSEDGFSLEVHSDRERMKFAKSVIGRV